MTCDDYTSTPLTEAQKVFISVRLNGAYCTIKNSLNNDVGYVTSAGVLLCANGATAPSEPDGDCMIGVPFDFTPGEDPRP
jgi:hypothetical protein